MVINGGSVSDTLPLGVVTLWLSRSEYINGKIHRTDGPAIEWNDGGIEWWINGKRHREDGPACEYISGDKYWYLNGINYTEQEFHQEVIKLKLKRLIELC